MKRVCLAVLLLVAAGAGGCAEGGPYLRADTENLYFASLLS